ncbi:MAG: FGGY-family carbohydrate kinase [Oscillospiraceae bacterium]|nr:FGGY-family carbohydrate kinase [Oscillospiraceae bacterium]
MNILVMESSTTSAKAMLYDASDGTFCVKTQPYSFIEETVGLQDPEIILATTIKLGSQVCHGKKVDAIALGCTFHAFMLCDAHMNAQSPLYQWTYVGASELCSKLRSDEVYVRNFYKKTGCMVNATYSFFKLKQLRREGKRLEDYIIADQGVYNMHKLTGECVITNVVLSGNGLLNINTRDLDDELLNELGLKRENMPELVPYNRSYPLSRQGAKLLGIEQGIPVMPAMPDGVLNQVGSGALAPEIMTFSVGTSAAMRMSVPKPIVPDRPGTWCYLSPNQWLSGAAVAGSTNCIDWCRERFFSSGMGFDKIEKNLKYTDSPPVFLPFIFGERCPGWEDSRLGGFLEVSPGHTAYDMYQAVQEGILFNLYQCYEVLVALNGKPSRIKLSGGILNSPLWLQMCADIFQTPMEADPATHASVMGAVAVAMERLGVIGGIDEVKTAPGNIIRPNGASFKGYIRRYEAYLNWYAKSM